jgi:hypothetical protein
LYSGFGFLRLFVVPAYPFQRFFFFLKKKRSGN